MPATFAFLLNVSLLLSVHPPAASGVATPGDTVTLRRLYVGTQPGFWGTDVSPDGRFLTQTARKPDGNLELIPLPGGRRLRVTSKASAGDDAYAEAARFSPDGRSIAFVWNESGRYEIRATDSEGSGLRTVLRSEPGRWDWVDLHGWCSGTDALLASLYRTGDPTAVTVLVDVVTGDMRQLLPSSAAIAPDAAACDPSGRYVGFDDDEGVHLVPVEGGERIGLAGSSSEDQLAGWGPGGSALLVKRAHPTGDQIWKVELQDGHQVGDPELVMGSLETIHPVAVRGGVFYFGRTKKGERLYSAGIDLDADDVTPSPLPLPDGPVPATGPSAWSSGGAELAYTSSPAAGSDPELAVRSWADGQSRAVASLPFSVSHLWWGTVPGRFLVAPAPGTDGTDWRGLYEIDVDHSIAKRYMRSRGVPRWAVLSADRTVAWYASWEGEQDSADRGHYIKRHDLHTGRIERIARLDTLPSRLGTVRDTDLSSDGDLLAFRGFSFEIARWTIGIIDLSAGTVRSLVSQPPAANEPAVSCRLVTWTADGEHVVYAREVTGQDECILFRVPADGGEAVAIGKIPSHRDSWTTSFSPDRSRVVFLHGTDFGELWAMEGIPWPELDGSGQ